MNSCTSKHPSAQAQEIAVIDIDADERSVALAASIRDHLSQGCVNLVLDLQHLRMLDSERIGALIMYKKMARDVGGDLHLLRPRGRVKEVLEAVNLGAVFGVFEYETAARAAFGVS